jgi:hypothetical protein
LRPRLERAARLAAPADLNARILDAVDAEEERQRTVRRAGSAIAPRPHHRIPAWGWTAAAAAVVALLFWAASLDVPGGPKPSQTQFVAADGTVYSDAEVEAAAAEVEVALSVLSETMERTGRRLQHEMNTELREHLNDPLRQGFGRTLRGIPYLRPRSSEEHSGILIPPRDDAHRPLGVALPGERT